LCAALAEIVGLISKFLSLL